ncbi:transcription regulator LysR family protein [Pigmentiphaga litoralis]|uniref:LysR substrate-binding domain-containing protein n=1 Tax=Pigmentiphaga litoralis TaxID=516702 RepID=UPI001678EA41|nr:LysR substrate-binding domain-containing protein [Pigmentiphaga litoralis]GGX12762.1 transcription regulator LysR family protein [Pigmentiphaga litoralis]
MELRHLRYFVALAQQLNFTHAARKVHVSQSTLSHQIRQLEEELGQTLFDRTGKQVRLTQAGERFLPNANNALREVDSGIHALRRGEDELRGRLAVGATHTFGIGLIPTCIAEFMARHRGVQVSIEEGSADWILQQLRDGRIDLGVAYRPASLGALRFEPLYNEEMVLAVAPGHPLAARKRIRIVELHGRDLVLLPAEFATRQLLDEAFRAVDAQPHVVAETNSMATMIGIVRRIEAGCIVSERAASYLQGLHVVRLEDPSPVRTPGLVWNGAAVSSPAAEMFASLLRRIARDEKKVVATRLRRKPA